jgi:hypothetical protein
MTLCPVPGCAVIFFTITLWFSMMIVSTFCSLHFVVAVLGQLLQGRSVMSLLLSFKHCIHCSTLQAPMQHILLKQYIITAILLQ